VKVTGPSPYGLIINQGLDKLDVALSGPKSEGGAYKRMTLCVQDARCQ
jgi:hypothetical protein